MKIHRNRNKESIHAMVGQKQSMRAIRIGVFGLHPNAGATFVSLLCAEYFTSLRGERVTIVERDNHSGLRRLPGCLMKKNGKEGGITTLHGITLLSAKEHESYIDCLNKTDSCTIYDLGCCYPMAQERMDDCDALIFVFHLCDWKFSMEKLEAELLTLWQRSRFDGGKVCLLGNLMSQEDHGRKNITRSNIIRNNISFLGYEPNVYMPSAQAVSLFDSLFSDLYAMVRD